MTATGQRGQKPTGGGKARVVVAGAGFGGLAAVRGLARAGMRATLIDRNIYATFQPLLYEVATGGLTSSDVAYPARAVSRRHQASFRHGELASLDPAASPPPTTASPGQPNTAWACTPAMMPSFCATGS
jgi:2-polyprenyl-6-methoxyphenol hydroxylase-like FAD-dependent oxidoreductase